MSRKASLVSLYATISGPNIFEFCRAAVANSSNDFTIASLARWADKDAPENRELRGVISTAATHLGWIGNKPVADFLGDSTLDLKPMRNKRMTVYVGLGGRYIEGGKPLLRLLTNSWADANLQEGRGSVPNLGILNEYVTAVGRLGSIDTLLGMGAGHGCQLLNVIRNIPELQGLYKSQEWESWLSNSGTQMFYSPREWTTSDYLSKMAGMTEIHGMSKSFSNRGGVSQSAQARRYLLPEETRELSKNEMWAFADNVPGIIRAGRRPYWEISEFNVRDAQGRPRYDPDPFHLKGSK